MRHPEKVWSFKNGKRVNRDQPSDCEQHSASIDLAGPFGFAPAFNSLRSHTRVSHSAFSSADRTSARNFLLTASLVTAGHGHYARRRVCVGGLEMGTRSSLV